MRILSPLRKITTRELVVYRCYLNTEIPWLFSVIATLACGHRFVEYGWSFNDLVYAYSDNPEVTARRHRCHECRDLALDKKPVGSVTVEAVAVVA